MEKHDVSRSFERQGASRRFEAEKPAASALPLTEGGAVHLDAFLLLCLLPCRLVNQYIQNKSSLRDVIFCKLVGILHYDMGQGS